MLKSKLFATSFTLFDLVQILKAISAGAKMVKKGDTVINIHIIFI